MASTVCGGIDCVETIGPRTTSGLCKRCYRKRHYESNREYELAGMTRWREGNRERERERFAAYHAEHRDELAEKKRRDYQANRDEHLARAARYRAAHPDAGRRWRETNPERWAMQNRENARRRRRAPDADPVDYAAIRAEHGMTCHLCSDEIPSFDDLHFDHVIPLAKSGPHVAENIRPAHAVCNLRKGTRLSA